MPEPNLKRILMTGDTVGGVWTYTMELIDALGAHGVEVCLATLGREPNAAQRAEAARVRNLLLHTSNFKLEWMDDPWADVEESGRWLIDLAKQFEPDVIHLNSFGHGALPWKSPVILAAHSCVLSWWEAVRREPLPPTWNRYRAAVRQSMRTADVLIAPSRAMLQAAERHYGPDLPEYRMVATNGRSRHRFQSRRKEPFILTAGRLWDEAKNATAVASAAARLPWPVFLAGEARGLDGTMARFDGCTMLGTLAPEERAGWYGRAAIYAAPARYEPFGYCALEAALSGCALVLGDIESLREVWEDAAVYVDPDDPANLEEALTDLIANPERRQEMSRRARARANAFTPEKMARTYLEACAAALERGRTACVS
jgi:glycosyltransferase involved in cell wall biosynthesis